MGVEKYLGEPDPIHSACEQGDAKGVIELLEGDLLLEKFEEKAPGPNSVAKHAASTNREGFTPLFHAALSGEPEVCRALIEHGADPLVLDAMGYNCVNYAKGMLVRQLLKNEQTRIEKKQECLELLAKADAKLEEYRSWLLRVEAEETRESSIRDKVSQASGLGERKERKALPTGQPASAAHGQNARAPAATPPLTHGRLLRHRFLRGLTRGLRAARGRREGIGQRGRCGALPPRGDSCGGCAGAPACRAICGSPAGGSRVFPWVPGMRVRGRGVEGTRGG